MEIRSVTLFTEPDLDIEQTAAFFHAARGAFAEPVQSTRLAFPPFPEWWPADQEPTAVSQHAARLAADWKRSGAAYISLGPVQLDHDPAWLGHIPAILAATDTLFAAAAVADTDGRIDVSRCRQVAQLIGQVSALQANGFGNLYLAALAHCPPGAPFFPVAYHRGGPAHFALAVEAADLALDAVRRSHTLDEARANLITAVAETAAALTETAVALSEKHEIPFSGIDFSLAPFPEEAKSLAAALEALGLPHLGGPGSLFAAGFITEALDRADFQRCGFSGLMLPVLEDSILAQRAADRLVTLSDLLSYAAVCGVGLDTVPLPGDAAADAIAGILLDVAMLAARLRKPLTARLMPLPGLKAGDPVSFDFPYFADSRVMPLPGEGVGGALAQPALLDIQSIHTRDA